MLDGENDQVNPGQQEEVTLTPEQKLEQEIQTITDPDVRALREAELEVIREDAAGPTGGAEEAELDGGDEGGTGDAADPAVVADANEALPAKPAPAKALQPIPTARFNEVLSQSRTERDARVKAEGQLEMITNMVLAGTMTPELAIAIREGRAEMPTTPVAKVDMTEFDKAYKGLDELEDQLADQLDKGEITNKDYVQKTREIRINRQALDGEVASHQAFAKASGQIDAVTKAIEADFPILKTLKHDQLMALDGVVHAVVTRALKQKFGPNVEYDPQDPEHIARYRFEMASQADKVYGDGKGPLSARNKAANPAGNGNAPAKPAANAQPTVQQRKDKLQLAANMPPNPTQLNTRRQDSPDKLSLAKKIENMNTEELDAFDKANPGVLDAL